MTTTIYSSERLRSYKKSYTYVSEFVMNGRGTKYVIDFHKIPKAATLVISERAIPAKDLKPNGPRFVFKYTWTWYETNVT